uniref:Uncharacterized protein n=1 Tax=Arundo donax TaxID=35708 RepID=A0A0A9CQY6_ARUDO
MARWKRKFSRFTAIRRLLDSEHVEKFGVNLKRNPTEASMQDVLRSIIAYATSAIKSVFGQEVQQQDAVTALLTSCHNILFLHLVFETFNSRSSYQRPANWRTSEKGWSKCESFFITRNHQVL